MFNRPFNTVLTRLAIVAAILATLVLIGARGVRRYQ